MTSLNRNITIAGNLSLVRPWPGCKRKKVRLRIHRLAVVLLACVLSMSFVACRSKEESAPEKDSSEQAAAATDGAIRLLPEQVQASGLKTQAVVEQEVATTLTVAGRVKPRAGSEAQVFSPFPGRLAADPAKLPRLGTTVSKGTVIGEVEQLLTTGEQAQINSAAAQFAATAAQLQTVITQAQQEVAFRQAELERSQQLYEAGAIPLKQVQSAEFTLKQAQTQLEGAMRSKEQSESAQAQQQNAPRRAPIVAPISGTVVTVGLTAGQLTDVSKSLLTLVDLSSVWVEIPIHESDLPAVRGVRRAEIHAPADPSRTYIGQLVSIGNVVDPVNRTVDVIFGVNNIGGSLKLEMTAEARIPTQRRTQALLVPASSVLYEEGQRFVFVEGEPGVFLRRRITIAEQQDDRIIVTSGLRATEKVVSVGAASLRSETLRGQITTDVEDDEKKERR